ncbi:PREDICTED: rho guanine nucleotide exchange factor 10-like protein [Priapulus caudatus]|uniref:Rho guanine nucleotide exchange factor 10-like protein n=1 Tax=Priapulus caudatus TaxID=37621 RepID=A0ABM1ES56_PRICU|nr:PREDICTED: rho guanine nucleotide exchange factor 10-like protein [Priapulus caudatus]
MDSVTVAVNVIADKQLDSVVNESESGKEDALPRSESQGENVCGEKDSELPMRPLSPKPAVLPKPALSPRPFSPTGNKPKPAVAPRPFSPTGNTTKAIVVPRPFTPTSSKPTVPPRPFSPPNVAKPSASSRPLSSPTIAEKPATWSALVAPAPFPLAKPLSRKQQANSEEAQRPLSPPPKFKPIARPLGQPPHPPTTAALKKPPTPQTTAPPALPPPPTTVAPTKPMPLYAQVRKSNRSNNEKSSSEDRDADIRKLDVTNEEALEGMPVGQQTSSAFDRDSMVTVVDLCLTSDNSSQLADIGEQASVGENSQAKPVIEPKVSHIYDVVYEPSADNAKLKDVIAASDANEGGENGSAEMPFASNRIGVLLHQPKSDSADMDVLTASVYEEPMVPAFPSPDQLPVDTKDVSGQFLTKHEYTVKTHVILPHERSAMTDESGYEYATCPFCPNHGEPGHEATCMRAKDAVAAATEEEASIVCAVDEGEYDDLWLSNSKGSTSTQNEYGRLSRGNTERTHEVSPETGHIYNLYDDSGERVPIARQQSDDYFVDDDEIYEEIRAPKFGFTEVAESESTIFWSSDTSSGDSGDETTVRPPRDDGLAQRHSTLVCDKPTRTLLQKITRSKKTEQYDPQQAHARARRKIDDEEHLVPDVRLLTTRHPPPCMPLPPPDAMSENELVRRKVVAQVVDTENSYVSSLTQLVEDYEIQLLNAVPPLVGASKVKTMFFRVRSILQCHMMFRIGLAAAVSKWHDEEKIGDVFIASFSKAIIVDIYSDFVNNFTHAVETARRLCKQRPPFADFMKNNQVMSKDRLSFFGLMVKPVQRFPQYILLLQDLMKRTPAGHYDRVSLQMALTTLECLAEKLNRRKLDSEHRLAVKQILRSMNVKFALKSIVEGARFFVREDAVAELEFDEGGGREHRKPRKLILMNDMLICAAAKRQLPGERGTKSRGCYNLKWSVNLRDIKVVDSVAFSGIHAARLKGSHVSLVSQQTEKSSGVISSSGGVSSAVGSVSPGAIRSGIHLRYDELNSLVHDFTVVSQIDGLLSSLHRPLPALNHDVMHQFSRQLQCEIRAKDDEIALFSVCQVNISLPSKSKSQGRFYFAFETSTPKSKKDWLTDLHMCQVALEPSNNPAWDIADSVDDCKARSKLPLFVAPMPVYMGKAATEVRCGAFCTAAPAAGVPRDQLWVCSSDRRANSMTVISLHKTHPELVHSFELRCRATVQCMAVVPQDPFTTIWLGTDTGEVCIYKVDQTRAELVSFCTPGGAGVAGFAHVDGRVFVALSSGRVAVYRRALAGGWRTDAATLVALGDAPVTAMLPAPSGDTLWCACGRKIFLLDVDAEVVRRSFYVHHERAASVGTLARAGVGVWCSIRTTPLVRLFHAETYQLLQELNVASAVGRLLGERKQPRGSGVAVTTLVASSGYLWIGTSVGIVVVYALPRLEGVPVISNKAIVSYHSHKSAVTMLVPCLPAQAAMQQRQPPRSLTKSGGAPYEEEPKRVSNLSAYDNVRNREAPPASEVDDDTDDVYTTPYAVPSMDDDDDHHDEAAEEEEKGVPAYDDVAPVPALPAVHSYVNVPSSTDNTYDTVYDANVEQRKQEEEEEGPRATTTAAASDDVFEGPYAVTDIPHLSTSDDEREIKSLQQTRSSGAASQVAQPAAIPESGPPPLTRKNYRFNDENVRSILRGVVDREARARGYSGAHSPSPPRTNLDRITSMYGSLMNIDVADLERENSTTESECSASVPREGDVPMTPPLFPKFPVRGGTHNDEEDDDGEYGIASRPAAAAGLENRSAGRPRTMLVVSGGSGYFNWSRLSSKDVSNSDAHVMAWEMKLVG